MYVKPPSRQLRGVYVPDNYNGTAFQDPATEQETPPPDTPAPQKDAPAAPKEEAAVGKTEPPGMLSSLFSGFGGLRSDDLLLLALMLLLSRSEKSDGHGTTDILPLLALLLFLG